mmetsp:Transcript_28612/g.101364  ORF Transcript_28612/g.101364 Transcript_28612/m.101364 type:complete len:295 (-) Transcript_28612:841-1725(-)
MSSRAASRWPRVSWSPRAADCSMLSRSRAAAATLPSACSRCRASRASTALMDPTRSTFLGATPDSRSVSRTRSTATFVAAVKRMRRSLRRPVAVFSAVRTASTNWIIRASVCDFPAPKTPWTSSTSPRDGGRAVAAASGRAANHCATCATTAFWSPLRPAQADSWSARSAPAETPTSRKDPEPPGRARRGTPSPCATGAGKSRLRRRGSETRELRACAASRKMAIAATSSEALPRRTVEQPVSDRRSRRRASVDGLSAPTGSTCSMPDAAQLCHRLANASTAPGAPKRSSSLTR